MKHMLYIAIISLLCGCVTTTSTRSYEENIKKPLHSQSNSNIIKATIIKPVIIKPGIVRIK